MTINGNCAATPEKNDWTVLSLSVLATIAGATLLAAAIQYVYTPAPLPVDVSNFIMNPGDFRPEPVERAQYISVIVSLPLMAFFWLRFFTARIRNTPRIGTGHAAALLLSAVLSAGVYFHPVLTRTITSFPVSSAAALTCSIMFLRRGPAFSREHIFNTGCHVLLVAALVSCCLFEATGVQAIDTGWQYAMHFSAVFNSVAEVMSGKHIMVDFNNQYGLYPVFLKPLFGIIGLNVLKFSAAMAFLSVICWLLIYGSLRRILRSQAWAALTCTAAIFICQLHTAVTYHPFYYQGIPLRLAGPAALTYLGTLWFYRNSRLAYWSCCAAAALSVMWNFDTGAVVFLTWILSLIFQEFTEKNTPDAVRAAIKHILINSAMLAIAVGIFSTVTFMETGRLPEIIRLFYFSTLFYGLGYFMLKMPLFHGWIAVGIIYTAGIVYSMSCITGKKRHPQKYAGFMLSVLGCGLFSYYQGRSVTSNLQLVAWPALSIAALFIAGRDAGTRPGQIMTSVLTGLMVFCAAGAAETIPQAILHFKNSALPELTETASPATCRINFIGRHVMPGEEVLILSYNAAVYHLYTGTRNPLFLPGESELYLKKDLAALLKVINSRKYPIILESGAFSFHSRQAADSILQAVTGNYEITGKSECGMTLYFPLSTPRIGIPQPI